MDSTSRARSAGARFASTAVQSGMAMGGGLVYYGTHALASPKIYGTDAQNVQKRAWILPVLGVIGGSLVTAIPKASAIGHGIVGGATAIGAEQLQMAMQIKKNAALQPGAQGVGALLEPGDRSAVRQLAGTGEVDDAGALYQAPSAYRRSEAAGLSI